MTEMRASLTLTADGSDLAAGVRDSAEALEGLGGAARATGQAATEAAGNITLAEEAAEALRRQSGQASEATEAQSSALEDLAAAAAEAISTEDAASGIEDLGDAAADGGHNVQNAAFQVGDFFTQVAGGTPPMQALAQQLPQLLGGFGVMGAVAGAAAAAIVPLTDVLLDVAFGSDEAEEEIRSFTDALADATELVDAAHQRMSSSARDNIEAIREEYGRFTADALDIEQRLARRELSEALDETLAAGNALLGEEVLAAVGEFVERRDDLIDYISTQEDLLQLPNVSAENAARARELIRRWQSDLEHLRDSFQDTFEISPEAVSDLERYSANLQEALDAENFDATFDAWRNLILLSEDAGEPLDSLEAALEQLGPSLLKATELAQPLPPRLDEARQAAEQLGTFLEPIGDRISQVADRAIDLSPGIEAAADATLNWATALHSPLAALERIWALLSSQPTPINIDATNNIVAATLEMFPTAEPVHGFHLGTGQDVTIPTVTTPKVGGGVDPVQREAERAALEAERARLRAIQEIERAMDRLAPSYARDVAAAEAWRDQALATLDSAAEGYDAFSADVQTVYEGLLAEAYDEDLARRRDWEAGVVRGLRDIEEATNDWASVSESLIANFRDGAEEAFVSFATTGKLQTGSMVDYVLEQLARLTYQSAIDPAISALIGLGTDALSSAFGGLFTNTTTGVPLTTGILPPLSTAHSGSPGVMASYPGGLRSDEQLTVTRLGEKVFTPEQMANGRAVVDALAMTVGGRDSVTAQPAQLRVEIHNHTNTRVEATDQGDGTVRLDLMDRVEREMGARMATGRGPLASGAQAAFRLQRDFRGRS